MRKNNVYLWLGIGIGLTVLLLWFGRCQHNKGRDEVLEAQKKTVVDSEVDYWQDSTTILKKELRGLKKYNDDLKVSNRALLGSLTKYQAQQLKVRVLTALKVTQESDSTKDDHIDSIQLRDKNGLLIRYVNYICLSNSYDSCQSEKRILLSTIKSDSTLINKGLLLQNANDSLSGWNAEKIKDIQVVNSKKIRRKNFWLFAGWGTAISETALFVYSSIKNFAK